MSAATGPVLRDIHLPAEPGWWPPAPGWWLLATLVLALLAWLCWRLLRHWRQRRARRVLQRELESACVRHSGDADAAALVAEISALLRRAAMRHAPHASKLQHVQWLAFLDGDDPSQPFQRGPGRLLLDGPYRSHIPRQQADALVRVVRTRLDAFVQVTNV